MVLFDEILRANLDITQLSKLAEDMRTDLGRRENVLFWGAGCSMPEVPASSGFVKHIHTDYQPAVRVCKGKGKEPDFQNLMAELPELDRRAIIGHLTVGKAPNWSHILAIWLMKSGFIHRIYTLNFDSLLLDACSLLGFPVDVYDFATISLDRPDLIQSPAIVYLHGQRHGFRQRVIPKDSEPDQWEKLFLHAKEKRHRWIVIGYSGSNDQIFPLFKHAPFMGGIYWVAHRETQEGKDYLSLSPAVLELLKDSERAVSTIPALGSDQFMKDLSEHLELFPPPLFLKPAEHMDGLMAKAGHLRLGGTSVTSFSSELVARTKAVADDAADTLLLRLFFKAARNRDELLRLCDQASRMTLPESFRQLAAELLIAEADRLDSDFREAREAHPSEDGSNYLRAALALLEAALRFTHTGSLGLRYQNLLEELEREPQRSQNARSTEPSAPSESADHENRDAAELATIMAQPPVPST